MPLSRRLLAEALGTLLLVATVVGSGIMGTDLSAGNDGIALLANATATAGILYALIVVLSPISGAHFNPAVTLAMRLRGELTTMHALAYIAVQVVAVVAAYRFTASTSFANPAVAIARLLDDARVGRDAPTADA